MKKNYIVAIRSNHYVDILPRQHIQHSKWHKFQRVFSDLSQEKRFIREIIPGKRGELRYWQITTDSENLSENYTWYVMSRYPGLTPRDVGNFYGLRTWVEYGLKQSKNEWWDNGKGWKTILNNFRLIIQPFTLFNLIYPWLTVFPIPQLAVGFSKLQSIIYHLTDSISIFLTHPNLYFSSAA